MRRAVRLLTLLIGAGGLAATARADPATLVRTARAQAQACDLRSAIASTRAALAEAETAWAPDAPGRLVIEQDLATYLNRTFAPREAEAHARRAVALAAGRPPAERAQVTQNLAVALAAQGRRAEAGRLLDDVVALAGQAGDAGAAASAELAYGEFELNGGRPESALVHLERASALTASGAAAALRLPVQMRLADAYRRLLRLDDADRAIDAAARGATGAAAPARLTLVRAAIATERGRIAAALKLTQSIDLSRPDACDPLLAVDVAHRRATLHLIRRELPEASAAFTAALGYLAPLRLAGNPREAEISYGLAVVAAMSRDFDRAATLFDRTAAAFRAIYGGPSEAEAQTLIEKARMLGQAGRASEGVAVAEAAVAMLATPIEQAPLTKAYAQAALGLTLRDADRRVAAKQALGLALDRFRAARGGSSFDLAPGLQALGEIALADGAARAAEDDFRQAIAVTRRWGGSSAVALGTGLSSLSAAQAAGGARSAALASSGEAVEVLRRRLAIGEARPWNDAEIERRAARTILTQELRLVTAPLAAGQAGGDAALVRRTFAASQLANAASTGAAIAQMAARLQQGASASAAQLGERNDLAAEWRAIQDELIQSLTAVTGEPASDARRDALIERQEAVAARIATLDAELVARDPKLDLLVKSRIVDLAALQARLGPREAALVLTVTDDATYAVVATATRAAAFRTALGRAEAARLVDRVRAALDPARWRAELPPVDLAAALAIEQAVVAPALPLLDGVDTLLVVPDGPFASLPFAVLPTAASPPPGDDAAAYTRVPWLIRRFALLSFPSAASIVALRTVRRAGLTGATMLGVGAPVLDGPPANGASRGTGALRALATGTRADPAVLRTLAPLPDTRIELEQMARTLGASRLLLAGEAREPIIRRMPLDGYGIIVFATHGLVAGELTGFQEPALVLTPPATATDEDDGLLTASEVALLRLRADWVILSACNTAAGDGSAGAEPLSGLAKSFFYAGARSMLVTHWSVDSEAAAKLTVATVRGTSGGLSPAHALRQAELDFIDDRDGSLRTHPFFWAPFGLVGD